VFYDAYSSFQPVSDATAGSPADQQKYCCEPPLHRLTEAEPAVVKVLERLQYTRASSLV